MTNTIKRTLRPLHTSPLEQERYRVQDGVEIFEREVIESRRVRMHDLGHENASTKRPRLTVTEPNRTTGQPMLARSRSEIAGLRAVLEEALTA
jgi:hypothetical protein